MSVKSGSTASAATVQVSNQSSVPWQVHWKNPGWTQYTNSSSSSSSPSQGRSVGVATARVACSEIVTNAPAVWELLDPAPREEDQLLLTMTLLDPSDGSSEIPVASEVLLEWMHCDTQAILLSRHLVWPETMGSATRKRDQASKFWTRVGDLFLPWLKQDETERISHFSSDTGIIAATICRQPLTKQAIQDEALEVISSMMAGLAPAFTDVDNVDEGEKNYNMPMVSHPALATSSSRELRSNSNTDEDYTTDPLLCVVCLSSRGLVCIYSVWDLFCPPKAGHHVKSSALQEEQTMATWFLGTELFQQLESTWLPLSQPKTTISLSILNDDWNLQSSAKKDEETILSRGDGMMSSSTIFPKSQKSTMLLIWSPWIESTTLPLRTVYNQATSIQVIDASSPLLVVLGEGIPHDSPVVIGRRTRKSVIAPSNDEIEPESTERKEKSIDLSTSLSQEKSEEKEGDWWTEESCTVSVEDKTDDDRQDEWWALKDSSHCSNDEVGEKLVTVDKTTSAVSKQSKMSIVEEPPTRLGGFVTLCSVASWSESKTIFLDFVPRFVTYVGRWHGMELLLCIGDEHVVAIRLDAPSSPVFIGVDEDLKQLFNNDANVTIHSFRQASHRPTVSINRFQVLPVELSLASAHTTETKTNQRILCAAATSPPSLLQIHTELDESSLQERGLLVVPTFAGISEKGTILTSTPDHGRVAKIPVQEEEEYQPGSLLQSAWGYLGLGWSLLGAHGRVYFLCWEGATASRGISFLQELPGSPRNISSPRCVTTVLQPVRLATESLTRSTLPELSETNGTEQHLNDEQDLVVDVIQSISSIRLNSFTDSKNLSSVQDVPPYEAALSHQQKSERLLRHLSSWTQLEDNDNNRELLDRHVPVIAVKATGGLAVLKMRQVVMENGGSSPFSQVLGWLSQKQDYFTAASIALDLLHEPDTLYHLWKHAEMIDEEGEQTKLHGLLDGIIPLETLDGEGIITKIPTSATWIQLADMTVGCLVKGGLAMSKTLLKFLRTNQYYNPARASLMLVAAAANTVSGDPEAVASAMGEVDKSNLAGHTFTIPELLWPVRCLLEIGVARDYLGMALNLLNATIHNELRRLPRQGSGMTIPPLDLTKALVTMIISSDSSGVRLLLDLPNEGTISTFWSSLHSETQQALALIQIRHNYPMLFHEEVREWTRILLHGLLKNEKSDGATFVSNEFLRELATACLFNAGCDLQDFVLDPTNISMISIGSENSTVWADLEMDGEDGLFQHKLEIVETRNALEPAPGSGGLDFDLLIACLLLLQSRQTSWREGEDRHVSTQALLDAACYLAGRPLVGSEEPRFSLDPKCLMQLCALSGNVRAGANLIGGKNGFVLSCCELLMLELQISMEEAENFVLDKLLDTDHIITLETSKFQQRHFELTDSHRQLLWLLDEHVLTVRTYGEFEANHHARGRVDPVFAARSVFRVWLCLTFFCKQEGSDWITRWLTGRLGLQRDSSSRHRLACAAMVRALLWPGDANETTDNTVTPNMLLGHVLKMDTRFLIQLAQAACGLVESVPPTIAEGLIGLTEATQELYTSFASAKLTRAI